MMEGGGGWRSRTGSKDPLSLDWHSETSEEAALTQEVEGELPNMAAVSWVWVCVCSHMTTGRLPQRGLGI